MSETKTKFLHDYALTIEQDVIWGDMDAFEHVNNTVYFRYFEDIRIQFFEKTGVMKHMDATNVGPILASTGCQFRAPLAFPDKISIGTRISELPNNGEKRFTMEYAVYSESQDCIACKGDGLVVFYDYQANKSCEIPVTLIETFKKLQNKNKH
jgi:acyl-CoA thioester hydrolase